jgi:hypothetical protein
MAELETLIDGYIATWNEKPSAVVRSSPRRSPTTPTTWTHSCRVRARTASTR